MKKRVFTNEHDIEAEGLPSASGFDAEFRCLGKRALCATIPKEAETAITVRGQRIHKALEVSDFGDLAPSDERTASRIMYAEGKLVHDFSFEGAEISFEQRVWDVDFDLNHLWSARIDAIHWQAHERRLFVPDYKSGWGIPPPLEINWQVRSEAALLAEMYGAEEVVAAIIHPHHAESLFEARVFQREELADILDTVRLNVAAIQLPDQPRRYGGIQCQFCTAKAICPEYQAEQGRMELVIADYNEDRGYTEILRLSKEQRGEDVRRLKEFKKNVDLRLDQYAELAGEDDTAVSGYTLAHKVTRSFSDEGKAMELVREEWGSDLLYDALHMSLVDLEEALAKKFGTKTEAKQAVWRLLSPVIRKKEGKGFLKEARSL